MRQLVPREYVDPCLSFLYRAFRLVFGASRHVKDKATRRRSQFLSIMCVVFEIMYLVVVIWEPSLIEYALAGILIMVLSYILSRTRYTTTTKLLFIYGTTIWNLYMVVYTARRDQVSTALRLIGLPFSSMMIFMVAVLFKRFLHSLLHVLVLEIVYVTITLWASSTNTSVNMVNTFRGTIMMGILVVGFAAIATLDLAELHKHKQRFKTLFDLTGEAVFVCRDETIVDVNVSFESLFRCRRDDVIGKLTLRNILPDFPLILRTNSMSSQSPTEVIIETVDKVKLWAEVRVHTGVLEGNAVSVFTVTDITTRKQVQEAETRALRAAVANEAKNQFLATMSHEMRTPIAGVMSSVDLLDSTSLSKEQRSLIDLTRVCARSLLDTINDILDFTKIETGKLELDCTEVNLVKLVEDCVLIVCGNAHKKSLEIVTTVSGDVPMHVMGDSTRIKQVLLNFLSNAVKFTHAGQVLVHLSVVPLPASAAPKSLEDKVSLKFTVSDSGIGINPKYFAKLFEPFGQLDTGNTRKYGGTGLGLSISRRFCEKMGGTVALVHSEEGKGSTFEFNIVLDKLKDDTLTHLGSEIGNALHESVGIGDTPEIASLAATPNTTPPSPFQPPPPLSLSQSLPPNTSLSPTSQQSLTTFASPSQNPLFVSSSSSSISSASASVSSSSTSSLSIPEVWVALVLEPNKFTAQSLLHYCKLLSFHPDLSFAFDSPTDLLKFLAGGSARTARKRTTSHRGSAASRRRVVLFVHTQYREAIDRACAAGDATIADRVFAWVWITPAQGASQRAVAQSGAFPQRMTSLAKPIFFSDMVRCMLNLFQPIGALSLWLSYFPDHLHNSLGRSGGNAEKFNRENITMSVGASLLPSVTSTPNMTPAFPPPTPSFPLSFPPSTPSLPPSEPPLIVSTYLPHPSTENLHVYDPSLFARAPLSPLDPHPHLPPSHYATQRHHDLRATQAQENYLRRQWGITQDSPDPAHAHHLYQNAARAAGVHTLDAQALRAAGAYPMHALGAQAPRVHPTYATDVQHPAHVADAQALRTGDSRESAFTDSASTASSDDFYYNNYHCHISSPSGVLSSSILTSSALPSSPHASSPSLIPSSPPLIPSSPPLTALSPPTSPPGVVEVEKVDGKESRRESNASQNSEENHNHSSTQNNTLHTENINNNNITNNNITNNNITNNNITNNNINNNITNNNITNSNNNTTSSNNIHSSNEKNSNNMPFSHNNIHLYNKFINPPDYSKIEESPTISSTILHRKDTKQRKILIVDDNIVIRKLLSKMLASCGFSTFTAPGGQQALDMLKGDPTIDLILLDIQMPEMDGYEVTRQIRQSEAGTGLHVPIIAITANAVSTERNHCLEVGMDDCLIKPVQKDFLLQILSFYLPPS